jgi:hypothetical protein
MSSWDALIVIMMVAVAPMGAGATEVDIQEFPIETILARHVELNGKVVSFRGMLVSGGMGNQGLCSDYPQRPKCLWFGGIRIFSDFRKREPNASRFIVQGRVNDRCIRQECTDSFAQIEDAVIVGQY